MKIRTLVASLLMVLVCVPVALAADSKDDIKKRMKARYPALKTLKEENKVGETHLGYVEAVTEKAAKDEEIIKVVSDENADREMLYKLIAKETKTTPEVVGKNNALRIFKKAEDSLYFKGKDGNWRQKKDVKTKEK